MWTVIQGRPQKNGDPGKTSGGSSVDLLPQASDRTNGGRDQGPGDFESPPSVPPLASRAWKSMTSIKPQRPATIKPRTKQAGGHGLARSYSNDHIADHRYTSSDNSSVNTSKSYSHAGLARDRCEAGASKVKPIAFSSGTRFYCNVVETHFKRSLPPRPWPATHVRMCDVHVPSSL